MANSNGNMINLCPDKSYGIIEGLVDFSVITKRLEGKELELDNQRKQQHGMQIVAQPHTRLSVTQAHIVPKVPGQEDITEQYLKTRIYASKAHAEKGDCFTGYNKSKYLPFVYQANGTQMDQIQPEGELANGLRVRLVMRIFPSNKGNKGCSLESVTVMEPIRYQGASAATEAAAVAMGFTIGKTFSRAEQEAYQAKMAANGVSVAIQPEQPAQAIPPASYAPVQPPVQNVQPQTAPPAPAPVPQTVNTQAAAAAAVMATPAPYAVPPAPAPAPTPAPAPVSAAPAPAPQAQPVQSGGLVAPAGYTINANGEVVPVTQVISQTPQTPQAGGIRLDG